MRPDDDLPAILAHAWTLLVRGGADRKSPVHTPVIASVDEHGLPHARVMVLRKADPAAATLRLHTDARSPKVAPHSKRVSARAPHRSTRAATAYSRCD
jgi:pyridoxine/pyridoxamine 5'-phosphate oxidase